MLELAFGFLSIPQGSVVWDASVVFNTSVFQDFSCEDYQLGLKLIHVIWVNTEEPFGQGFSTRLKRSRALEVQVFYRESDVEALPNRLLK